MLRSVHMKLVMIMVLLILSLMAVVGAFLINSVMAFYLEEFYTQMSQVFDQSQNPALSRTLQTENSGEENGAEAVLEIMQAYSGELGLDGRSRTLYILDGETGAYLAGTDEAEGRGLEYNSPNLTRALVEKEEGTQANIAADYMDVALPFSRGGVQYVIYILDNKSTVNNLINQIFVLILESLVFGLFISILLSFLLSKTMIIPIQRLTEGAMRVAEGDFSRRIEVTSRDEIGVLTDTFNDMARQLRDTLRQVENERNKLDTLFLHMTDGVVAFDREGRVIHSNPAAAVMLGCSIGGDTTYGQLFGGLASLEEVMAAPDHLEAERQVRDRCLELLMAPFDREQQGGVLAVLHDVTEQRKNQELQREFVANVSHELRTPLTNIRSYAETLSDSAGDIPPAMEKKFLGVILGESDRMTHIVQDLLTLSRFDSGRDDLKLARFSYEAAEGSDRYPLPGTGIYEAVEGCRDLAQRAVSAVGGEERLFLLSAQETGQNSWEIRFGYSLNGIQVRLGEDGWAARFTVEQGRITGFQLRTRRYTDAGTTTVVLPERQAMAAMEAKGHENEELLLVYLDTGAEMVTASWAAASELSGRR